jgi:anti-sigma factor RsiW
MMSDELIHSAVDGGLRPEDRQRLERLLAENPDVVERLSDLHRVSEWLDELGYEDPPAALVSNVMQQVRRLADRQQRGNVTPVLFGRTTMSRRKKVLFGLVPLPRSSSPRSS